MLFVHSEVCGIAFALFPEAEGRERGAGLGEAGKIESRNGGGQEIKKEW